MWFPGADEGGLVVKVDEDSDDDDEPDDEDMDDEDFEDDEDSYYDYSDVDARASKAFLSELAALLDDADLSSFNAYEGDTEFALIDQKYGEDGENGPYVFTEVKEGRKLKWSGGDYDEEEPDLHGCGFAIAGAAKYMDEDILSAAVEALGGSLEDEVMPETDYVICNDIHGAAENMKRAWEYGVSLLPEPSFIRIFTGTDEYDKARFGDLYERIKDETANPFFDDVIDLAMKAGESPLRFDVWKDGKWVEPANHKEGE